MVVISQTKAKMGDSQPVKDCQTPQTEFSCERRTICKKYEIGQWSMEDNQNLSKAKAYGQRHEPKTKQK